MTVQTTIETQIISHSRKSFAEVIAKIESLVSKSDRSIFERTLAAQTVQERIDAVESLKRRSGFMVLNFADLDDCLWTPMLLPSARLYVLLNPLISFRMMEIAPAAGLYLPVRVLVYEGSDGETSVVCDRPSAQLGEMAQNATVRTVAETLDAALEELVERSVLLES
jgi:uncharacterized protein (DUF302 family)